MNLVNVPFVVTKNWFYNLSIAVFIEFGAEKSIINNNTFSDNTFALKTGTVGTFS